MGGVIPNVLRKLRPYLQLKKGFKIEYTKYMDIIIENIPWMAFNVSLGIIAVVFGWLAIKLHRKTYRILCWFIWLLFIPNTIYMLTDIIHLAEQLRFVPQISIKTIIFIQYTILLFIGVETFILGIYPVEKMFAKSHLNKKMAEASFVIFLLNFVIAFGVVVGRVQRTNSWEVVTNISKVKTDILNVFTSSDLLFLVLFFGLLGNIVYFTLRNLFVKNTEEAVESILKKL